MTILKKIFYCYFLLLMLFALPAIAQNSGSITLDHVDGEPTPGVLAVNVPITFHWRLAFTGVEPLGLYYNVYSLTSPDGLDWDSTIGTYTGVITETMIEQQFINVGGATSLDGLLVDTIGFSGFATGVVGIPSGFDEIVYTITIGPISKDDHAKTLCIDSTNFPTTDWLWSLLSGTGVVPSWDGPHCFTVDSLYNDLDGDGILDSSDNCIFDPNPLQEDTDGDMVGDSCDNCLNDFNDAQEDTDADGIGDSCDTCTDTDGDGWGDPGYALNTCADDNCPSIYNPNQSDLDLDGIGDICDPMTDLTFDEESTDSADVFAMVTGDLNRDNYVDIVYSGGTSTPGLFITWAINGDSFELPTQCINLFNAALAIDFVNSDSFPDIAALTVDTLYILINDGFSNDCSQWNVTKLPFPNPIFERSGVANGAGVPSISTGYFDNDKNLDIFVGPSTMVYGDGTGNTSGQATVPIVVSSVVKGDLNNDGHLDLVAVENDFVELLLNDGSGNFVSSASAFVGTGYSSQTIKNATDDLDNDCNTDFVVVTPNVDSTGESVITVGYGDGLGNINQSDTMMIDGIVREILLVDIDRDNILDLIASNSTEKRVEIYRGNGDRTFDIPEFFSTANAGGGTFSLAAADFDRDGQPDFLSGGSEGGNLLFTTSNLADIPVLQDEMVVTGLTNVTMQITNPLGYSVSDQSTTIAGADVWRLDANSDDTLDEQIIDYNLLDGDYDINFYIRPEFEGGGGQALSASVRINGSQQVALANDLGFSGSFKSRRAPGCATDSITLRFNPNYVTNPNFVSPRYGVLSTTSDPEFKWGNLVAQKGIIDNYHIQISRDLDFDTPDYEDSTLTGTTYCGLGFNPDTIYYWRVRWRDNGQWSEYSNPMVAYIGGGCCVGPTRGDINSDGGPNANILDLNWMVNYIFRFGNPPSCLEEADVNANCAVNVLDLNYLVNYIFRFGPGPAPCPSCSVCPK